MRHLFAPAILLLAACGQQPNPASDLDQLDRELTAANAPTAPDPAVRQALRDQIMVDPQLQQSSNANAVRPPDRPDSGAIPSDLPRPDPVNGATLRPAPPPTPTCPQCTARVGAYTLGALAAGQPAGRGCAAVSYSAGWANRLPADLPLYPDARLTEAAGTATSSCRLRAVSFASAAAGTKLINWYHTRATSAGYHTEHQQQGTMQVLGGTRGADAFVVWVSPRPGGGMDVDLVTNTGT